MRRSLQVVLLGSVLLALTACSTGNTPTAGSSAPAGAAPTIEISGHPVPYDRPEQWTTASVESRTSSTLNVFATGSTTSGGAVCGPPAIRFQVRETKEAVRILVLGYQLPASPDTACPAIGYLPSPHAVRLASPLGARRVVDASSGRTVELIDGSQHPNLPHPPAGLGSGVLSQLPNEPVSRVWSPLHGDGYPVVWITDQAPATASVYGRVAMQSDVHGTPATVYEGVGGAPGLWIVQWTPNPKQTITLNAAAGVGHRWNASAALQLARSVTNYRTTKSDRLGQPTVPGTVAATYNSADGPVTKADELLKSSGVDVGLDCAGRGHVTVTIRDKSRTIPCTAAVTHHEFESIGKPFDSFQLTVRASTGVRWSLSLARASLDGS